MSGACPELARSDQGTTRSTVLLRTQDTMSRQLDAEQKNAGQVLAVSEEYKKDSRGELLYLYEYEHKRFHLCWIHAIRAQSMVQWIAQFRKRAEERNLVLLGEFWLAEDLRYSFTKPSCMLCNWHPRYGSEIKHRLFDEE
jgi:hypothetical protein